MKLDLHDLTFINQSVYHDQKLLYFESPKRLILVEITYQSSGTCLREGLLAMSTMSFLLDILLLVLDYLLLLRAFARLRTG